MVEIPEGISWFAELYVSFLLRCIPEQNNIVEASILSTTRMNIKHDICTVVDIVHYTK